MCVQVRREYRIDSLDADRAGRFAAAALLNVLTPTDWQISSDVELVVGQYMHALRDRLSEGTAAVEVTVHTTCVELVVGADDPRWVENRVRLRPRRPFAATVQCDLPDLPAAPPPKPVLWPALGEHRSSATREEWTETWQALHDITQTLRRGGGAAADLTATLDAVAAGVVKATRFTVAAVNLVIAGGDFQVVAVQGPEQARQTLLGVVEPAHRWMELIEGGTRWGRLCYFPHDAPLLADTDMISWAASQDTPSDPSLWNPMDVLIAPLYSLGNECLGALSVDLPSDARRPGVADLERLEVFADHAASAVERAQTGQPW